MPSETSPDAEEDEGARKGEDYLPLKVRTNGLTDTKCPSSRTLSKVNKTPRPRE